MTRGTGAVERARAVEKQNARDVNPARSLILGIGGRAEIISGSPGSASASDSGAGLSRGGE